jgi:anti-anti-sigma regulatory factor
MEGNVYAARVDAIEYIKFTGTVRYSHCAGLESHINKLFDKRDFDEIAIDMMETEILDSTALGLLARISIEMKKYTELRAVILIPENELLQILKRLCFDQVFNIVSSRPSQENVEFEELAYESQDERVVLQRVIEAHKNLASMADSNESLFHEITQALR